uniref:Intraflagellar transport protein 122 n=1 Tax=Tetraselmis sp. GSL018 TaxID=582737 RepID=A0A061R9P9_9CHLO
MHYRVSTKIQKKLDCNLLVVTSHHVILCQERKLQLYGFNGVKEREWVLESIIRYIKVVGGPEGREGLLVGLKSGQIFKIFVDNPFPISLIRHSASIRCLDLSASRNKLAVVDENTSVFIYHLISKELLFEDRNCNSVAWNTEFEDMFCYSGNGMLSIKTGDFPLHQQKLQGFVVGFKGSKIFCLHYVCMQTIDVPQGASLYRYVEKKNFDQAYKTACLGVTEGDWRLLAMEALQNMSLDIARKAFIRVRDMRYIDLLNAIEVGQKEGQNQNIFKAQIAAYQGKYEEAAKLYAKAGAIEKAMEMFGDLKQFEAAKRWAEEYAKEKGDSTQVEDLINRQAEWSEEVNDFEAAADMYIKAKKFDRAIAIIGRHGWYAKLAEIVTMLQATDTKALQMCAQIFRKGGQHELAKEVYIKLQDHRSLIQLHVEHGRWDDAFLLLKTHPEFKDEVYLPRAQWLAAHDMFDEARVAFREAGRPDRAIRMLEQLTHNAVLESRFSDAAHYYFLLAMENLQDVKSPPSSMVYSDRRAFQRFQDCYDKCEIYYAYELIYRASSDAFSSIYAGTLFNAARFLLMRLMNREAPMGVSMVKLVHMLAKQSEVMEAYKLARFAYDKLQGLRVSPEWQSDIDLSIVLVRAKPFSDKDEMLPVCWRCGTTNALLNPQGDFCFNCGSAFHRSFLTFEHLPLVEFELEDGIGDAEAISLLEQEPGEHGSPKPKSKPRHDDNNADVLQLDTVDQDVMAQMEMMEDPWQGQMMIPNQPIRANRHMLKNIHRSEVIIRMWPNTLISHQYFRIMDPDMPACIGPCGHFYEQDEYEMAALEKDEAPLSRTKLDSQGEVANSAEADPNACFTSHAQAAPNPI